MKTLSNIWPIRLPLSSSHQFLMHQGEEIGLCLCARAENASNECRRSVLESSGVVKQFYVVKQSHFGAILEDQDDKNDIFRSFWAVFWSAATQKMTQNDAVRSFLICLKNDLTL